MLADLTDKQVGDYQLSAEMSRGAMATVYRAFGPRPQREVALKTLRPEPTSDREAVLAGATSTPEARTTSLRCENP